MGINVLQLCVFTLLSRTLLKFHVAGGTEAPRQKARGMQTARWPEAACTPCVSLHGNTRREQRSWETWERAQKTPTHRHTRLFTKLYNGNKSNSHPSAVVIQALSPVWLFVTPQTAAHQASLCFPVPWSLLRHMAIESVTPPINQRIFLLVVVSYSPLSHQPGRSVSGCGHLFSLSLSLSLTAPGSQ